MAAPVLRSALLASVALTLAACQTVGPDHRTPETLAPAAFDAASAAPVRADPAEARWWAGLGDPVLSSLVDRALGASLDVSEAEARIREARALRRQARSDNGPTLDANADVNSQRLSENGVGLANLPPGVDPTLELEQYRASFDARWEIDLFGRNRREAEGALAREQAAVEDLNAVRLSVASEIAGNYADHAAAQARIAVARRSAQASAETARLTALRRAAGEASDVDVRRAASQATEDLAVLPRLEADAAAALYAIDRLLGTEPGAIRRELATAPRPALATPPSIPVGLPSDLARRRPDVRRAERDLAAATADVGVATADLYPRFSLVGTLGLDSIEPGDFLESASRFWRIGPSLTAPLFDGGRRRAEVERRQARREAAEAAYRSAVIVALSEVETALVRYGRERDRTARLAVSEADLRRAAALTRLRYQAGEAALTDVLDAERQAARVEDSLAESRARAISQLVAVYKALGGGWETAAQTAELRP